MFLLEGIIDVGKLPVEFNSFRVGGYNKAIISFLKYIPQVYLNYSKKSTAGWSITNVLLDFTGGSLSILQQVIDMVYNGLNGDGYSFFGSGDGFNIVKFLLGAIACVFDIIFFIQHFILYRNSGDPVMDEDEIRVAKPVRHSISLKDEEEDDFYYSMSNNKANGKLNNTDNKSSKMQNSHSKSG